MRVSDTINRASRAVIILTAAIALIAVSAVAQDTGTPSKEALSAAAVPA